MGRKNLFTIAIVLILLIALPVIIYLARTQQIFKPRADADTVTFTLNPETATKQIGQTLDIDINISSGTIDVEAILLTLRYDPQILRFENFTSNNSLGTVLKTPNNQTPGTLIYEEVDSRGSGTPRVEGNFKVGTLRFTALAVTPAATPTQLTFERALVGNSTATTAIPVAKPTGRYTIVQSTTNNLNVNVFMDDNPRNGVKDGSEVRPYPGVPVSLSGQDNKGPLNTDGAGNVSFTALLAGNYNIALDLNPLPGINANPYDSELEVTNLAALSNISVSGSVSRQIGVAPKTSGAKTPVSGGVTGPTSYQLPAGTGSPANYGGTILGKYLEKIEVFRVKNVGDVSDKTKWFSIFTMDCNNSHSDCGNNSNRSIGDWNNITSADVGEWIIFVKGYSYNGQKCTGNPRGEVGFADCGSNDYMTTRILGASPAPSVSACPANATICWRIGGLQCTSQIEADRHCAGTIAPTSTCNRTDPGPFGTGCTTVTCGSGESFCSRLNRCATNSECFPQPSPSVCPANQPFCPRTGTCLAPSLCNPTPSASVSSCTQSNGDANKDSRVDLLDHRIWIDEFLHVVNTTRADFNCDGVVDLFTDFIIWKRSYAP